MRFSEQMRETMTSLRNFRAVSNARNPLPARSAPFRKIGANFSSGYARILSKIGALRRALRAIRGWSNRRATRAQPGQRRATREPAFSYRSMRKMFFFQCGVVCAKKWVVYTCMCALNCEEPLKTFACDSGVSAEARDRVSAQYYVAAVPRADPGGAFVCRAL